MKQLLSYRVTAQGLERRQPDPVAPANRPMIIGTVQKEYDAISDEVANPDGSKPGGINTGMKMRRSYSGNWTSTLAASTAGSDIGKTGSWVSFSGPNWSQINNGSYDNTILSFFESIPQDHDCLVTYIHECNNGKVAAADRPAFCDAQARIHDLMVQSGCNRDRVKVGPILTAYGYRSNQFLDYYPDDHSKFDFVGVDTYQFWRPPGSPPDPKSGSLGRDRTMDYLCAGLADFCALTGKPPAVGEYGAHPFPDDPQSKPNRMLRDVEWFDNLGGLAFLYFHSQAGESGPWWLDRYHVFTDNQNDPARNGGAPDPDSLKTWRDILAAHEG